MLNELARESRRLGVSIGCYFDQVNVGAILVEHASARLTPVGQAHALFKPHPGAQLIEVARSHKRPARSHKRLACGKENVSGAPEEADLYVAASVRRESGQLTITIVNRSPDAAHDAELRLQNAAPKRIEGVLLSSDTYRPGSVFRESRLRIQRKGAAFCVTLPPHSVARISCS
jgi:alpha-L-arabinofuranosidase